MNNEQNQFADAIKCLVEAGWQEEEAKHLLRAINDKDGERLFTKVAPAWVAHCAESMRYVRDILSFEAQGLITVTMDETGEWLFSLSDKGIQAGIDMWLK